MLLSCVNTKQSSFPLFSWGDSQRSYESPVPVPHPESSAPPLIQTLMVTIKLMTHTHTHGADEGNGCVWRSSLRRHGPWIPLRDVGFVIIDWPTSSRVRVGLGGPSCVKPRRRPIQEWLGGLECLHWICPPADCVDWHPPRLGAAATAELVAGVKRERVPASVNEHRDSGVWVRAGSAPSFKPPKRYSGPLNSKVSKFWLSHMNNAEIARAFR